MSDERASERAIDDGNSCFLCSPSSSLIFASSSVGTALCGLGPLVEGYSVVGSSRHIPSTADLKGPQQDFVRFAEDVRSSLAHRYGHCLLTEHGRTPLCRARRGQAEQHCYHAHYLLFPTAPDIVAAAVPYFEDVERYSGIEAALSVLQREDSEYFLLSPRTDEAYVMKNAKRLMRQFSRCLVAAAIGRPELADWSVSPQTSLAEAYASTNRTLVPELL